MSINLRQIEYFMKVVELGSFSKAATSLHVAQPGISRQIRFMEEDLGVALLNRDGRGVTPTEAGQKFYDRSQLIFAELQELQADISGLRDVPIGEINIGIPGVVGAEFIAAVVQEFMARYPMATIRVVEGFSYQIVDWLQLGRLDMGIVYDPYYYRDISVRKLVDQSLYLVGKWDRRSTVPPTIDFKDAAKLPLIMPVRPNSLSALLEQAAQDEKVDLNLRMEVDSIFAIKQLIRAGEGYTIQPLAVIHEDVSRGELFASRIENPHVTRALAIAFPKRGVLTVSAKRLVELLEELASKFVADGKWSDG